MIRRTPEEARRVRSLRTTAWSAVLKRLRHEYRTEHRHLLAAAITRHTATTWASTRLRQRHPERASEIYAEELAARGLPAPQPQPRRWPAGGIH